MRSFQLYQALRGLLGLALVTSGFLVFVGRVESQTPTDAEIEARRVLATGQTLPVGMTLARSRIDLEVASPTPVEPDRVRVRRRRMIRGSFVAGGISVTFDVIRGSRTRDEDGPKFEIDVCFRNGEGTPFLAQYGGHAAMDPMCAVENVDLSVFDGVATSSTLAETAAAVSTAQAALEALQALEFKTALAPEYEALVAQATMLESFAEVTEDDDCSAPDTFCEPEPEGGVGGQTHLNNQWRHRLHVYAGGALHLPRLVGEHGATRAYRIHQVWGTQLAWTRCNHGRCPEETGMSRKCRMWSAYDRQHHVHKEACNTEPHLFSGWIGPRGHNCNDDVIMQQFGVRYNQHYWGGYGSGWPCDDPSITLYTPACFW